MRSFAGASAVTQSVTDVAGLVSCRYRWRLENYQQIQSRNAARVQRDPHALALQAGQRGQGEQGLESSDGDVRLGVYPRRSVDGPMAARLFAMSHAREELVAGLGEQAYWDAERKMLTARRGPRMLELRVQNGSDPVSSRDLATRVMRDVLSRLP
ncbi:MAG: hypothetical protein Q8Q09_23585 [Deltaproteobacteria bacterium]|nr:hypothetical protein [Deltaproteobacteria bacterium]